MGADEAAITTSARLRRAVGEGAERRLLEIHTEPLEPVSTVGSGDAFVAGYVAARYEGRARRSASPTASPAGPSRPSTSAPAPLDRDQVERLVDQVGVARESAATH